MKEKLRNSIKNGVKRLKNRHFWILNSKNFAGGAIATPHPPYSPLSVVGQRNEWHRWGNDQNVQYIPLNNKNFTWNVLCPEQDRVTSERWILMSWSKKTMIFTYLSFFHYLICINTKTIGESNAMMIWVISQALAKKINPLKIWNSNRGFNLLNFQY